jgi:hypothetical protein
MLLAWPLIEDFGHNSQPPTGLNCPKTFRIAVRPQTCGRESPGGYGRNGKSHLGRHLYAALCFGKARRAFGITQLPSCSGCQKRRLGRATSCNFRCNPRCPHRQRSKNFLRF